MKMIGMGAIGDEAGLVMAVSADVSATFGTVFEGLLLLRFMDFCSGIGGGRLGLERLGHECVGHCEINDAADATYRLFFGEGETNYGDLMKVVPEELPDFDVMIAGFPCQTFSINGKRAGFEDDRGLVIYGLAEILTKKNVPYFILENVKGLVSHDKGRTLQSIVALLGERGYDVDWRVLSSVDVGVPQARERVYIQGARRGLKPGGFTWPVKVDARPLNEFLRPAKSVVFDTDGATFRKYLGTKYNAGRVTVPEILAREGQVVDTRQSDIRFFKHCPTLRTGRHGLFYVHEGQMRRLTGYESLLLQGFPEKYAMVAEAAGVSEGKLLAQTGNAMTVDVVHRVAECLLP